MSVLVIYSGFHWTLQIERLGDTNYLLDQEKVLMLSVEDVT